MEADQLAHAVVVIVAIALADTAGFLGVALPNIAKRIARGMNAQNANSEAQKSDG